MYRTSQVALFAMFASNSVTIVYNHQGTHHVGIIRSIEHEDGSGKRFNVRFADGYSLFIDYSK
jgi:hypothetical protein